MFAVLQGIITVANRLDQPGSFTIFVTATDNWNGTVGIRQRNSTKVRNIRVNGGTIHILVFFHLLKA